MKTPAKTMRSSGIVTVMASAMWIGGCAHSNKPFIAWGAPPAPAVADAVQVSDQLSAATTTAATTVASDAGDIPVTPPGHQIAATNTATTGAVSSSAPASTIPAGVAPAAPLAVPPPVVQPTAVESTPSTVATSALGSITSVPGLAPKPKPFIAVPKPLQRPGARPSTLLLEHASPDSPVPLEEFSRQPAHSIPDFHLRPQLSVDELEARLGQPAQLADTGDPWYVYRLHGEQELWLHFSGPALAHLDAADVIRGAEDGYIRDRVFSDEK